APFVLQFLGRKMRTDNLSAAGLAGSLEREIPSFWGAMPAGLGDLFWPRAANVTVADESPVVAQSVIPEVVPVASKSRNWVLPLAIGALALGALWFVNHWRRPAAPTYETRAGTADRLADIPATVADAIKLPEIPKPLTIDNIELRYRTG